MIRSDNRQADEIRKVSVTKDFLKYAEGSCLIELGSTKVVCSASIDENVPPFLKNSGNGWVTAEYGMLPRSCKTRVQRNKDSGRTYEIQRLVGRSLRAVTDMRSMGERTVRLDCDVIQADGGTRTAAITGSFIALVDAFNKLKNSGIIRDIPVKEFVAATSVGILNGELLMDLCYDEDSRADVDINVVMTSKGEFIEIQGTAERRTFDKTAMNQLIDLAAKGIEELIVIQRNLLKGII